MRNTTLLLAFIALLTAPIAWGQTTIAPRTGTAVEATNVATAASVTLTNVISPNRDRGIMLYAYGAAGGAVTNGFAFQFYPSGDGTNYVTRNPVTWVVSSFTTNVCRDWTNFPRTVMDNARRWQVAITNYSGATIYLSNLTWSAFP